MRLTPDGNRKIYTRNSGLSKLYLNDSLDLYSGSVILANSVDSGRVVLVSGAEGIAPKISAGETGKHLTNTGGPK